MVPIQKKTPEAFKYFLVYPLSPEFLPEALFNLVNKDILELLHITLKRNPSFSNMKRIQSRRKTLILQGLCTKPLQVWVRATFTSYLPESDQFPPPTQPLSRSKFSQILIHTNTILPRWRPLSPCHSSRPRRESLLWALLAEAQLWSMATGFRSEFGPVESVLLPSPRPSQMPHLSYFFRKSTRSFASCCFPINHLEVTPEDLGFIQEITRNPQDPCITFITSELGSF